MMMVVKVTMLIITTTIAKHHHSNLGPNNVFFSRVNLAIHSVINDLFESIDLDNNFTNQSSTKLLLTMHHDLKNIADVAIDTYNVIQEIINEKNSNQSYYVYSVNDTEEDVKKLDTIVNEILNKKNFDVYRAIKGTKHKYVKGKREDEDQNTKAINPAFENSKEFTEFVIHFLAKVNNLSIHDFKKSAKYGRLAVSSKKNLKAWEAPTSLTFDLEDSDTRRIFGGSKTHVKSFPFIVSIHIMGEFTCSGCIISRDLVITAASCLGIAYKNDFFERNLKSIYVRLGSDHTTRGGETIPVQNLYFHPEFKLKNLQNNLAIIRLEKRIRFSRKQKKIRRILWDKTAGALPNDTKEILILGWGATKRDQFTQKHPKLRISMLDVYNTTDCKRKYTEKFITTENFCAALNGTNGSACNGDVGGPGIVGGTLVGVVSFGAPECGVADVPTVFTKLGYYRPWIESIVKAHNKTNNDSFDTRRKNKHSNKKRFQVNKSPRDKLHGHDKEYPEDEIALRDTLIELVKDDQSMVHDVIYGDLYDEFNKFFKPHEDLERETKQTANPDNITPTPFFEFKISLQTYRKPKGYTKTPMHTTTFKTLSLGLLPDDFDYETDNYEVQNDYSDNYEKSSEEEHGLSIEAPPKEDGHEATWSSNSESDSNKRISDESTDYSQEMKDFFATNPSRFVAKKSQKNLKNKDSNKMRNTGDDNRSILRNGKEKGRPKVMKHDKLSKHASSVLDEGKSLATKTVAIDFDKKDVQVNNDKHKRKNNKNKASFKKRKGALRSDKTVSQSFFLQF